MIDWGFSILIILYCFSILYLWMGWERIAITTSEDAIQSVAVLIPIRNEAATILGLLKSLIQQSYNGPIEIIIINDHSQDDSYELVERFIKTKQQFKLISLEENEGKKAAISAGVKLCSSDIILTTDGDCIVLSTWVETMVNAFEETTQFVSGPVKFRNDSTLFAQMQSIEFASLIGSGAALIGWQRPVMANGANMAFRKSVFLGLNGFEGNAETASGDDVFLLHKIAAKFPNSVAFAKQEGAIIETAAQPNLKLFIQQRIRWASKWKAYKDLFSKLTAMLVFIGSLSLIVFPFLVDFERNSMFLWANLWIIKSFFDYYFIRQVSVFLGDKITVFSFVLLQVIYPFYVVFTAFFSLRKSYVWKGRTVQ